MWRIFIAKIYNKFHADYKDYSSLINCQSVIIFVNYLFSLFKSPRSNKDWSRIYTLCKVFFFFFCLLLPVNYIFAWHKSIIPFYPTSSGYNKARRRHQTQTNSHWCRYICILGLGSNCLRATGCEFEYPPSMSVECEYSNEHSHL